MKRLIKNLLKILYIFPVKEKKIFFMSFNGKAVGFDSKAFAEWLNSNAKDYKLVWGVASNKDKKNMFLPNTRFVKIKSFRGIYDMITSEILFYNINPSTFIPYRKKQILINTWHGFAYKKVGKYTDTYSKERFNLSTCFLSHAKKYTDLVLKDSFDFKGDILKCGVPRNDIFFNKEKIKEKEKIIRQKYHLQENEKIILYAPTFRGDFKQSNLELNFNKIIELFCYKFKWDKCRILCRFHPMINHIKKVQDEKIIDVSDYPDMQDLLCVTDILISDYSSVMWDFSLTKKIVIMYTPDIAKYNNDRGLYIKPSSLPFVLVNTIEELIDKISKLNVQKYDENLKKYFDQMGNYESGESCKKIYDYIEKKRNELKGQKA